MATTNPDALTKSLGHPGGHDESWHHQLGPGFAARGYEETDELEGSRAIAVFDRMRKTDGQIGALVRAIVGPILANRHSLLAGKVKPHVRDAVARALGIMEADEDGRTPRGDSVTLSRHLAEALLAPFLGVVAFETRYAVVEPPADLVEKYPDVEWPVLMFDLAGLDYRSPRTYSEIRTDRNGRLAGIIQAGVGWDVTGHGRGTQVIGGPSPSDNHREVYLEAWRLVTYSYEREGADWWGSSILRSSYKNWLLKDELLRIDAMAAERNGMGLPLVYYSDEGTKEEALNIAAGLRAGAYAGGAVPDGKYRVELLAPNGQVRDVLPSIKYHDEAAGRSALAMFLNLGHDNGAKALGDTFVDYFMLAENALDNWVCEVVTEQVIRPFVAANFGVDEMYPVLQGDELTSEGTPTAEALKSLVDAKIITPDEGLETEYRRRLGLPKAEEPRELPGTTVEGQPGYTEDPADLEPLADESENYLPDDVDEDPLLAAAERLVNRIAALRAAG